MPNYQSQPKPRGIVLLVVLSALTFFSLLIAAYVVLSSQARESSFAISTRNIKAIDHQTHIDRALMTLIRGTDDINHPFFGEDLLSDYWGVKDFIPLKVRNAAATATNGFINLPVQDDTAIAGGLTLTSNSSQTIDDEYSGRIITFTSGKLRGKSFKVLRSLGVASSTYHDLVFEQDSTFAVGDISDEDTVWMNGIPRNAVGVGFDGTNINLNATVQSPPSGRTVPTGGYPDLPVSLQPNHFERVINKHSSIGSSDLSDFDEPYDAADHNNWFLCFRRDDGTIIPSFHRPSVLNYILNHPGSAITYPVSNDMFMSLSRATFRPIPTMRNGYTLHEKFTGGNSNFALRQPLALSTSAQMDQFMRALVNGDWDVDNDSDGKPDSIWVDLGLPMFTSPEGKLLKPLVAVMIEDLSGRLNVNVHSNYALSDTTNAGLSVASGDWALGGTSPYKLFRGLGYGPSEINFPRISSTDLDKLFKRRYFGTNSGGEYVPGIGGIDDLNILTRGFIPNEFKHDSYYGNSMDPYGRTGYGISPNGNLANVNGGRLLTLTSSASKPGESHDNPYESDPTGSLNGDVVFSTNDFEPVIRFDDFDGDQLSDRLRQTSTSMIASNSGLKGALTAISKSDDRPILFGTSTGSTYYTLRSTPPLNTLSVTKVKQLIPSEIRLGQKMDLNRRFGNGVDDSPPGSKGFNVIDEPSERSLVGADDDGDGSIDEADEASFETEPFKAYPSATIVNTPGDFIGVASNYSFDEPATSPINARQLYARHLYVLMMAVSNGIAAVFPSYGDTLPTPTPVSDRNLYRAHRLAQWAVNVVDFRDADSIMTAFEYDVSPFDATGWDVDGNLLSIEGPHRFVVWGAENPELILKESLALHDVRVRDTNFDSTHKSKGTSGGDDDDTDQVRRPEGSLFFELYCPRQDMSNAAGGLFNDKDSPLAGGIPRELYKVTLPPPAGPPGPNKITVELELDRTVTTHFNSGSSTYGDAMAPASETPVWRIAISERHPAGQSPLAQSATLPDTLSFQPERLDELDNSASPTNKLKLERFVFFKNYADLATLQTAIAPIPDITTPFSVYFYQSGGPLTLQPEQYLALAPKIVTNIGSDVFSLGTGPVKPSSQRFEINGDGLVHYDVTNTRTTPLASAPSPTIKAANAFAMGGFAPAGWPGGQYINMNVSEPLGDAVYYQVPTQLYTQAVGTYPDTDAYVEFDAAGIPVNGEPLDTPEDMRVQGPIYDLTMDTVGDPNVKDPVLGSFGDYRTAFLQRLADPTQGFHPVLNPYITVDQISIDLNVISGEDSAGNVTKPGAPPSVPTLEGNYIKGSRQKDGRLPSPYLATNVLFSYSATSPTPAASAPAATSYIENTFTNTFSYLNAGFGSPQPAPNLGRPSTPFAMHNWLNRPFASPMELMLVPACSPGRLFEEFSIPQGMPIPSVYPADPTVAAGDPAYAREFISPHRHLLNFFHSSSSKHSGQPTAEFATIFELVSAYAGYRGEWTPLSPSRTSNTSWLSPLYTAPFNFLPTQAPNGRINLNTLQNFDVWAGLMQGHMNQAEFDSASGGANQTQLSYDNFVLSRRGYIPTAASDLTAAMPTLPYNYDSTHLNPNFPTEFAGNFAPASSGHYAIKLRGTSPTDSEMRRRKIDTTVARSQGMLATQDTASPPATPLSPTLVRSSPTELPTSAFMNRDRSPFLRYQTLMRTPNLVTDNSQTYLVRMTVGYFEVDSSNTNSFGAEYNEAIGQNTRYRAMFIIDRSIPVGFIPGQDLNARNTVVFERYFP